MRTYVVGEVDQLERSSAPDLLPADPGAARDLACSAAFEATLYGLPAVLQYAQMVAQVGAAGDGGPRVAFNQFAHGEGLAGPDHSAFRVPNVDTVYSNVWFDLTRSPVQVVLPDFGDRYFTLNLLDMHSNASNISLRTHGRGPHRVLLAPAGWTGTVPDGCSLFRVATPLAWGLLRVQAAGEEEVRAVRALQDAVVVEPLVRGGEHPHLPPVTPEGVERDWEEFMTALHAVVDTCGAPVEETALVRRFRTVGVGGEAPFSASALTEAVRAGAAEGFDAAFELLRRSRSQLGRPVGGGWTRVADKGRHGDNFTARAVMNFVGLGANVVEENTSFNTFVDADLEPLDGTRGGFEIELATLPPVDHFWSLTLYEVETGQVHANEVDRYSVGSTTSGCGGPVVVRLQHDRPAADDDSGATWLPTPRGRFFLVLRAYGPRAALLDGTWTPPPVRPVGS
ncbi:DUF1254 domain-containing protein [Nocardioides sp. Arc9.136]|uniref:DUF1254 domain-containing protein n=1 Tax=Nocardioides sp. Arc9.136 TaxID=2996826 RepID=UPI002665E18A|nr:DUF1254 domain-containing protein [Nocardioides sp. Arc9.136]WKN48450.1 DUF1254 domain-containing protein [Nocardioides sp. Arc9.136]